jgi:uncharacterized membrane protein
MEKEKLDLDSEIICKFGPETKMFFVLWCLVFIGYIISIFVKNFTNTNRFMLILGLIICTGVLLFLVSIDILITTKLELMKIKKYLKEKEVKK